MVSIGEVVDSTCRVYDVERLRIDDTGIMPSSITTDLQALMYAIIEFKLT